MDTLIKLFISLIRVNYMNLIKPPVYCRLDECISGSFDKRLLIRDVFIIIYQRTPPASCSDILR